MSFRSGYDKELERRDLESGIRAQIELMGMTGEKLINEFRQRCAETLLRSGMQLIPSDHLQDHQFMVSRGVYEAAKEIAGLGMGGGE